MAFRLQKKARLMAVLGLTLMLSGCGAQLLSQREIVRAVFFDRSPEGYTAVLLLNDQQGEQDGDYKTASASGNTPALAWDSAASSLPGKAFYGLMDLAVLPPRLQLAGGTGDRRPCGADGTACTGNCGLSSGNVRADLIAGPGWGSLRYASSPAKKPGAALWTANAFCQRCRLRGSRLR